MQKEIAVRLYQNVKNGRQNGGNVFARRPRAAAACRAVTQNFNALHQRRRCVSPRPTLALNQYVLQQLDVACNCKPPGNGRQSKKRCTQRGGGG